MEMLSISNKYEKIPFPYFLVDKKLDIIAVSKNTLQDFDEVKNFLDIVSIGSKKKAAKFILETPSITKIELNLKTKTNPLSLFDVHIQYDSKEYIHIFCVNKEEVSDHIKEALKNFEQDLINENIFLMEKREELEISLNEMKELIIKQDHLLTVEKVAESISHEIRKPLTSVRGLLQMLKPHLVEMDAPVHYTNLALEELDRANDIIYEFLNTSKPKFSSREEVLVSKVLKDSVMICQSDSILANCSIEYLQNVSDQIVSIDIKQIKQVLLNIIKNAIEAIQESGKPELGSIVISSEEKNGSIVISIADNGIGMSDHTKEKLFSVFFTTKNRGTGIGLAVCNEIVSSHQGTIEFSSTQGLGSTFYIKLPVVQNM
ncbi:GHKL domain-containing protein [Bacillus lacus]|uniref:histidine kinase n=1 Tax=Metabacillus lacus TaxID=1983721 RepID=A0A7X2IXM7_9BACI|nr:ATP-binding protein [Metabacillus lacus]MRX71546.1 GHKL domain-containing protein [Metabacillus lacus]